MQVLFVGDKPSPKMKPGARPFEGAACENRLIEWIHAIIDVRFPVSYDIINQCDYSEWALANLSEQCNFRSRK